VTTTNPAARPTNPRRILALSALASGLLACGGADPPPAARPPALPPPPPPRPAASAGPARLAQAFAENEIEYVFTDPDRRRKIESTFPAIDALVEAEVSAQRLPGLVIGVVVDGELAHGRGFGVTDLETQAKPDADTVYRIGSLTKSFTALAVLALRDDGALALDDPLARFLPEAAGLVYPTRDAPPITLRQILTHTSGLPRVGNFDAHRPDREGVSEEELARSLSGFALESPPGSAFSYSNLGYGLLGLAAGRAARAPLRALVTKRILEPLGMTSTGWDRAGVPAARIATPYRRGASGALEPAITPTLGAIDPAGGLYSSLRDMARYVAFQLSAYPPRDAPDTGPVRRSSVREAHQNALRSGGLRVRLREAPAPGEGLVTASASSYGYGWLVAETCDFDHIVEHNGAIDGYSAFVTFLPESGVGLVALANYFRGDFSLDPLLDRVLLALKKGGGLSKRALRAKQLAPAFAAVMPRLLAVLNGWSEEGYRAMLSKARGNVPGEQEEIAGYRSAHGACSGYEPIEVLSPTHARFALRCERGALEMHVQLNPNDGLITGFWGISRDVPPPPPLARAAARVAGLIGKWDDGVYRRHLAPKAARPRAEAAAFFERLRAAHGACAVKSFTRWVNRPDFALACERGGGLTLTLTLDDKREDAVASYAITDDGAGTCPAR
jgi:CubicO group peptidase (beta-lactamase class C family)